MSSLGGLGGVCKRQGLVCSYAYSFALPAFLLLYLSNKLKWKRICHICPWTSKNLPSHFWNTFVLFSEKNGESTCATYKTTFLGELKVEKIENKVHNGACQFVVN